MNNLFKATNKDGVNTPKESFAGKVYDITCDVSSAKFVLEAAYYDVIDAIDYSSLDDGDKACINRLNAMLKSTLHFLGQSENKLDNLKDGGLL